MYNVHIWHRIVRLFLQATKKTWTPPGRDHQGRHRRSSCWSASRSRWGSRTAARWCNCIFHMNWSLSITVTVNSTINFDSLEYILAIASFDTAPLRTVVRESLEQSFRLVLVLKDTSASWFVSYENKSLPTFQSVRPLGPRLLEEVRQRPGLSWSSEPSWLWNNSGVILRLQAVACRK